MEGGANRKPPTDAASFERSQLDHALAILEQEAHLGRLPPSQWRWFRALVWYGYSVPVLASVVALLAAAGELAAHGGVVRVRLPALLDAELTVFVGTVLVFGPLNVLAAVCLFPLSAPLLVRSWRWRRRVRLAGLTENLRAPWERERARHRVRNALTLLIGPWLVCWGVVVALLQPLANYQAAPARAALLWVPVSEGWVLGCALFVLPIGFHYLALHFLLRDMERVAVVRRLIRELGREREQVGSPREESVLLGSAFRQAARIERAQIAREQLQTWRSFELDGLSTSRAARESGPVSAPRPEPQAYATTYSKSARDLRGALSELQRAALTELENRLSDDPDAEEHDRIPLGPDLFVYRHPRPRVEVTCQLDRTRRVVNILHVVAPRLEVPRSLFISYSHSDEPWLTEMRRVLRPLERQDLIAVWDDREIRAGGSWREEIERALKNARAALLLVSPAFLESEFIGAIELPRILDEARATGLQVFWVAVTESRVKDSPLFEFQSVNDPDRPLAQLSRPEQERELVRIYERIRAVVVQA